jgi:rod shape-determining protein MreD
VRPPRPSKFGEPISARHRSLIAAATVMAASLLTLVPVVATLPLLPPFGLLLLLAWRLRGPDILPVWAAAPLGLFDDLFSGQPLGSAMSLWTLALIAIDVIDGRLVWRDFWQDWLIAGGAVSAFLIGSRLAGTPIGAHVDTVLLLQIVIAIALYPLAAIVCARIDERGQQPR